jgi:coumaroylquinate(coumaroylshikimate) 3'-monooxygenase
MSSFILIHISFFPHAEENLVILLQDFLSAGNDTQAHTMKFVIRYIVQNPTVQRKLQEEVDSVVGQNRLVSIEDKQE